MSECTHDCRWHQRYRELELVGRQGWSALRWMSVAILSIALFQSNVRIEVQWATGIIIEIFAASPSEQRAE